MNPRKRPGNLAEKIKRTLENHSFEGVDENWSRMRQDLDSKIRSNDLRTGEITGMWFQRHRSLIFQIAASIVIILVVSLFFIQYRSGNHIEDRFVTDDNAGDIILQDSTRVWLNRYSTLDYPKKFPRKQRLVILSGEGYFKVKSYSTTPFIVVTNTSKIEVLGTEFNVMAFKSDNFERISVARGVVSVKAFSDQTDSAVTLYEGEHCIINKEDYTVSKFSNPSPNDYAWKTKRLVFSNTPVLRVAETLEELYDCTILFGNDRCDSLSLTATYNNLDLDQLISAIGLTLDLKIERKNDTLIVIE